MPTHEDPVYTWDETTSLAFSLDVRRILRINFIKAKAPGLLTDEDRETITEWDLGGIPWNIQDEGHAWRFLRLIEGISHGALDAAFEAGLQERKQEERWRVERDAAKRV
jgi:hypothetical protein